MSETQIRPGFAFEIERLIQERIANAVAAERERCARIAETAKPHTFARDIAALIRKVPA